MYFTIAREIWSVRAIYLHLVVAFLGDYVIKAGMEGLGH